MVRPSRSSVAFKDAGVCLSAGSRGAGWCCFFMSGGEEEGRGAAVEMHAARGLPSSALTMGEIARWLQQSFVSGHGKTPPSNGNSFVEKGVIEVAMLGNIWQRRRAAGGAGVKIHYRFFFHNFSAWYLSFSLFVSISSWLLIFALHRCNNLIIFIFGMKLGLEHIQTIIWTKTPQ